MSELPTPPFPELRALERKRPLPDLADLLGESAPLPAPPPPPAATAGAGPPADLALPRIPTEPSAPGASSKAGSTNDPSLDQIPVGTHQETMRETLGALMEEDLEPLPEESSRPKAPSSAGAPPKDRDEPTDQPDATDAELAEAFRPLLETGLSRALTSPEAGLQNFLEPMLRSTVRRAVAEQMESSRQFKQLGAFDRLGLRFLSLLTNRSYDDLLFTRTRRYQVEEVYLLQRHSKALLSYASHDPARHVSARRVQATVRLLKARLQAPDGTIERSFDLPERRLALVREGEHCLLVAIVRGRSNALVRADLDYVLRQVENRFGASLEARSEAFLTVLQPLLEGCLLIQSPAPPR